VKGRNYEPSELAFTVLLSTEMNLNCSTVVGRGKYEQKGQMAVQERKKV
jgi:hypothetical protein